MDWTSIRSGGMTALRRLRAARGGAAVLLTYHRVIDIAVDPQRLAVPTARFAQHVAALAARYKLLTTGDVFGLLAEGRKLPRNAVAITLDDGYADALINALPILEAHEAPATVFVCSGLLGGTREYWWDELERIVLLADELPERLEIELPGAEFGRDTSSARTMSDEDGRRLVGWDFTQPVTSPRQQLYLDLAALVEPLAPAVRAQALADLRAQIGVPAVVRPEKRALNVDELAELEASGLIEIGAHTVNHVRLGGLSATVQSEEIHGSKHALEAACGHSIRSFSYPHGTAGSYSAETVDIVRNAGFLGACTTRLGSRLPWGAVSIGTDRFAAPRTAAADVSAAELIALVDKRLGI